MIEFHQENHRHQAWETESGGVLDEQPQQNTGPATWPSLLRHLGVAEASEAEQIAAAREWLKVNRPTPMMRLSLDRLGIEY